ncbi:MAG: tRNA pseudouridine(55) synthase TruB [Rhodospirillales bacterium]|nr:tRNA pseudouridine(55) synthase TruB [Rhodospirillales bacterium]
MNARRPKQRINGWLIVDKPLGMTSTQAIGRIRRLLNPESIGHAGTLDPLASGVLPIAMGEATKTVPLLQDGSKTYRFRVRWGAATSTDDLEGAIVATSDVRPSDQQIRAALPGFIGKIQQTPPAFSAIKVDGARAYDLARAGGTVELKARTVEVTRFDLIESSPDEALFEADTGKGCYVRSLGRDLAVALGTHGHITELRRLRVGRFAADRAVSLDLSGDFDHTAGLLEQVLPIETALDDIPALALTAAEAQDLRHGRRIGLFSTQDRERLDRLRLGTREDQSILALHEGKAVALVGLDGAEIRPLRVFNL